LAQQKWTSPDAIAHHLVTNVGSPVRVHLKGNLATIPVEPFDGESAPRTEIVPLAYFDAVIEGAEIVDGGLNLFGVNGLHLPESEWRRIGLQKHWRVDSADLQNPVHPPERKLEIWASREEEFYRERPGEPSFDHLEDVPDDSPVVTNWRDQQPSHYPDKPPVAFSSPTLTIDTLTAEGVTDTAGLNRVEFATVEGIEILDDIAEWPSSNRESSSEP
jgi:hypothetical protein